MLFQCTPPKRSVPLSHYTAGRLSRPCSAVVEALERRTLLTGVAFNWIGGAGNWNDPSHWSHSPPPLPDADRSLPNLEDIVSIGSGAGTVTIPGNFTADAGSLGLSANLRLENTSSLAL